MDVDSRIRRLARRLEARDELGAVATEYGLLLAMIALVIVTALVAFGLAVLGLLRAGADAFA